MNFSVNLDSATACGCPTESDPRSDPFDRVRWLAQSEKTARQLGPERGEELLAVMIHPPRLQRPSLLRRILGVKEPSIAPWVWVQHVQVAAAFVIAHLDDAWHGSKRRDLLLSAALGPMDWTVDAAVIALSEVALTCPEAVEEVRAILRELLERIPRPGYCSYEEPAAYNLIRLGVPAAEQEELVNRLRRG